MIDYQPVILIGAPRSGTNMLRDIITQFEGIGTWPCDEINYVWRHGNRSHFTDEFSVELATPEVSKFIRKQFTHLAQQQNLKYVVEKTCANSLRVSFVDQIFPSAKYIFLIRDGRDTTASAMKRWSAPLDLPYTLRKARFVPFSDLSYYGMRFIRNRFVQFKSKENRIKIWGPVFNGMDRMLKEASLAEVCAMQWKRCVGNAERDFEQIASERVCRVHYETFVTNPATELKRIMEFLEYDPIQNYQSFTSGIKANSIGKWEKDLDQSTLELILPHIQTEMERYGYV